MTERSRDQDLEQTDVFSKGKNSENWIGTALNVDNNFRNKVGWEIISAYPKIGCSRIRTK